VPYIIDGLLRERGIKRMTPLKIRKELLPLLALAALLLLFWLVSSTQSVYADNGPQVITPGEGGGNDPPPPNTIEGCVINPRSGSMVAGINVYIYAYMNDHWMATNSTGGFRFQGSWITVNRTYDLSINGKTDPWNLGVQSEDGNYGQWYGAVETNYLAYGRRNILLEPRGVANVTTGALFSNTGYATLYFGTATEKTVSHTMGFSVPILGINVGYTTSVSISEAETWEVPPGYSEFFYRTYYTATYYDDHVQNVAATGVTTPVEHTRWSGDVTHEYYLDRNNLPTNEWGDEAVPPGVHEYYYRESGSRTWSAQWNPAAPFAIIYEAFGKIIYLDITATVTSGTTTWAGYRINNPTDHTLTFRVYTPGARYGGNGGTGGMELHVWLIE